MDDRLKGVGHCKTMENENDMEIHRGMTMAYYELCAKYDIHDAMPREHKSRVSCFCF